MRAWLEINLGNVVANAQALAARVHPAALCAVVKSNAYGHGSVPVSKALAGSDITDLRFGVFSMPEALELLESGVRRTILVLGPVDDFELRSASDAALKWLELAVLDPTDIARFQPGTRVHVKVDSGVSRFGVQPEHAARVVSECAGAGLNVAGIYSHLANAEDLDERFTLAQLERLRSAASANGALSHIAASAAAIMYPQTRLEMVRCGIALYGHWPSAAVAAAPASRGLTLSPALRWRAPVVQVRDVAAGEPVGYGCDFVPARDSTIAVLPLGYADGLPRAAGNGKLAVEVGGSPAPVVGRICMNACMLDVTGMVPQVRRGDVATIDVEDVARAADTINYEILARLPAHLERRYTAP